MSGLGTTTLGLGAIAAWLSVPSRRLSSVRDGLPIVAANDNRTPAGQFRADTLEIHLTVQMAVWRPEADSGPSAEVAAFAEDGGPPQIPGPLLRVPAGTFTAHLTLPRAGTFIYHTHMNDLEQLTSGLYGSIVVLEPGQRFDPETDHVFVAGWDGPADPPWVVVNGDSLTRPRTLRAGRPHRFRFVNIGPAGGLDFAIYRDTSLVTWTRIAKDGADLPPLQSVMAPAVQRVQVGETYDFRLVLSPGEYRLLVDDPAKPTWVQTLVVR